MKMKLFKRKNHKSIPKIAVQTTIPFIIIIVISLKLSNLCLKRPQILVTTSSRLSTFINQTYEFLPTQNQTNYTPIKPIIQYQTIYTPKLRPNCDLFTGEWVPNPKGPYYTNKSCGVIQMHQNCMKFGRPDSEFMKWRWKPDGCDLPILNAKQFLEIVKDKSLAFVGDSLARNHMQSLLCLLSQAEVPKDVSTTTDQNFKRWYFESSNFTLVKYWSPYLVKAQENDPKGKGGKIMGLYLDEADKSWATHINEFNYIIISAGHWFERPLLYHEKSKVMGCRYCGIHKLKEYSPMYGYRNAIRTAFRAILRKRKFTGVVFFRTFVPSHFEGGAWDKGGDCKRKQPYTRNEIDLDKGTREMYMSQMKEFRKAQKLAQQRRLRFKLMDMTQIMLMRPDGHPSKFGRPADLNVTWPNDCVHWCLPGPIDSWNDFLHEMIKD